MSCFAWLYQEAFFHFSTLTSKQRWKKKIFCSASNFHFLYFISLRKLSHWFLVSCHLQNLVSINLSSRKMVLQIFDLKPSKWFDIRWLIITNSKISCSTKLQMDKTSKELKCQKEVCFRIIEKRVKLTFRLRQSHSDVKIVYFHRLFCVKTSLLECMKSQL